MNLMPPDNALQPDAERYADFMLSLCAIFTGSIALVRCLIGTVQLWIYGVVSIWPGHEPASGDSAVHMLFVSGLVGVLFAAYGAIQVYRARRMSTG